MSHVAASSSTVQPPVPPATGDGGGSDEDALASRVDALLSQVDSATIEIAQRADAAHQADAKALELQVDAALIAAHAAADATAVVVAEPVAADSGHEAAAEIAAEPIDTAPADIASVVATSPVSTREAADEGDLEAVFTAEAEAPNPAVAAAQVEADSDIAPIAAVAVAVVPEVSEGVAAVAVPAASEPEAEATAPELPGQSGATQDPPPIVAAVTPAVVPVAVTVPEAISEPAPVAVQAQPAAMSLESLDDKLATAAAEIASAELGDSFDNGDELLASVNVAAASDQPVHQPPGSGATTSAVVEPAAVAFAAPATAAPATAPLATAPLATAPPATAAPATGAALSAPVANPPKPGAAPPALATVSHAQQPASEAVAVPETAARPAQPVHAEHPASLAPVGPSALSRLAAKLLNLTLIPAASILGRVPAKTRSTINWVAAVTIFNAVVLWAFVALQQPANLGPPMGIQPTLNGPHEHAGSVKARLEAEAAALAAPKTADATGSKSAEK